MRGPVPSVLAPWHLWGSSVSLTSDASVAGGMTASGQILKVSYRRPETWSFWFGCELLSASTPAPNMDIVVLVDLIAGVGRDSYDTQQVDPASILVSPAFVRFAYLFVPPFVPGPTLRRYTTTGSGPALDDAAPLVRPTIDAFPAQDIQARAQVRISGPAGSTATVRVSGFVSPISHVRPDWFTSDDDAPQFPGGETGGS